MNQIYVGNVTKLQKILISWKITKYSLWQNLAVQNSQLFIIRIFRGLHCKNPNFQFLDKFDRAECWAHIKRTLCLVFAWAPSWSKSLPRLCLSSLSSKTWANFCLSFTQVECWSNVEWTFCLAFLESNNSANQHKLVLPSKLSVLVLFEWTFYLLREPRLGHIGPSLRSMAQALLKILPKSIMNFC